MLATILERRRKIQRRHPSHYSTFHAPPQREYPHLFTILRPLSNVVKKFSAANHRPTALSTRDRLHLFTMLATPLERRRKYTTANRRPAPLSTRDRLHLFTCLRPL